MKHSSEFATTLATIAATAQIRWQFLNPEKSVDFAWFSVNSVGDASIDDDDLVSHFRQWIEANDYNIPDWMI